MSGTLSDERTCLSLLLAPVSPVILGFESRGSRYHILVSPPTTRRVTVEIRPRLHTGYSRIQCPLYLLDTRDRKTPPSGYPLLCFTNVLSRKPCVRSQATVWLLSVYNSQCPYPRKLCFVISWFPGINLSVVTCLPGNDSFTFFFVVTGT
jgi:hypothetical protein